MLTHRPKIMLNRDSLGTLEGQKPSNSDEMSLSVMRAVIYLPDSMSGEGGNQLVRRGNIEKLARKNIKTQRTCKQTELLELPHGA